MSSILLRNSRKAVFDAQPFYYHFSTSLARLSNNPPSQEAHIGSEAVLAFPIKGQSVDNGLDSRSSAALEKKYGSLALHIDLRLDVLENVKFLSGDILSRFPCRLMTSSLKGHLPNDKNHFKLAADSLRLGYQQIFFRPCLPPQRLLPDGTDTRFLPGDSSIWKYRLWAGGSARYNSETPLNASAPTKANQLEVIKDIRVLGKEVPEKVFVTVRRIITSLEKSKGHLSQEKIVEDLLRLEAPPLEEEYTLCFLRNPPGDSTSKPGISPPTGALFSHTMIPDANLLFQFSALTFNAHKIHLDPEYARKEYQMKQTVVHGPFTQLLLTEFLRISLATYAIDATVLFPRSIDYTNLRPLYANEPMTLCCKPFRLADGQEPWQADSWRVWIETGQGEKKTMAVKAVVGVGRISHSPTAQKRRRMNRNKLQEADSAVKDVDVD